MKQLIEEQREEYVRIASYTNEYGYLHKIPKYEDVWNWHKQSLKQFIDGLIVKTAELTPNHITREYRDTDKMRDDLVSNLKKLKEQLQ